MWEKLGVLKSSGCFLGAVGPRSVFSVLFGIFFLAVFLSLPEACVVLIGGKVA